VNSTSNSYNNLLPTDNASSFLSTASSISSASSSSSTSSSTWPTTVPQIQAVKPQSTTAKNAAKAKRDQEQLWDLRSFPVVQQDFNDDLKLSQAKTYPTPIGNKSTSQNSLNNSKGSTINSISSTQTASSIFDSNDEHHISFSKNGTEVVDFDSDFVDGGSSKNSSNNNSASAPAQLPAANAAAAATTNANDFLTVPLFFNDHLLDVYGFGGFNDGLSDDGGAIKTRRSNSLTTPTASGNFTTSSSAENLANLQKPRSFSLSMESSRNTLVSSGSETRLDDWNKLAQWRFTNSNHDGMSNIGVWLKSLRLHKYFWLFTNMSYEKMMDINEEYLETLGVTKGARHKLVLCIQKLAERVTLLRQLEQELIDGVKPPKVALDELTNIVLTPMKSCNAVPQDEDVAMHVLRVIECGE